MSEEQLLENFRYLHGTFNTCIAVAIFYQGLLGLRIRKGRRSGSPDTNAAKVHRRLGPVVMPLGVMGFLVGSALAFWDHGHILEYPLHFVTGASITILLISTSVVSRSIREGDAPWRRLHLVLGVFILCLYGVQLFFGLGILL
jgi:hypothetical protein